MNLALSSSRASEWLQLNCGRVIASSFALSCFSQSAFNSSTAFFTAASILGIGQHRPGKGRYPESERPRGGGQITT